MRVVVINAGSSSLKHALIDSRKEAVLSSGEERWEPGAPAGRHAAALQAALGDADHRPDAIGHRVVHGGPGFDGPAVVDAQVRSAIEELVALAPLHNRAALDGIDAATGAFPATPQVACFDTAFHRTIPPPAATYAIPHAWTERYGVRRYGFHGLNVEWCTRKARELLGQTATRRLIVCHLGSGSSVSAVLGRRSVDTSMGFTPMEGVPMATRSGSIDPGLVLYLARAGLSIDELDHGLNDASGLLGVSGRSPDLREVIAAVDAGDERARLAFDILMRGVAGAVGAMTTALGGLDCLVFSGGAGEGSARLRAAICGRLDHFGVALDAAHNDTAVPDTEISSEAGDAHVLVVRAGEEMVIARQTAALIESR